MIGARFERLAVVAEAGRDSARSITYLCRCDCGAEKVATGSNLRKGHIQSCGCLRREMCREKGRATATHGMTKSSTYRSWQAMRNRCLRPSHWAYQRYGGCGVSICPGWGDFASFLRDMGARPEGKTLDRINPFGNYEPGNCRWATPLEQAHNKRRTA